MSKPVRDENSKERMDKVLLEIFKDMKGEVMRSLGEMPVEDRDQYGKKKLDYLLLYETN